MKKFVSLFTTTQLLVLELFVSSVAHAGEGHDAGYRWAERYDITDTSYSNGKSESFNEGVREYAMEHQEN